MTEHYVTVKLTISELPGDPVRYRSRIDASPAGASAGSGHDFDAPERPAGGFPGRLRQLAADASTDQGIVPALEQLGQDLFKRVLNGDVGATFEKCRTIAAERNATLRLAITTLPGQLLDVPWEFLHDGSGFLILQNMSVVRVIDSLRPGEAPFGPIQRLLIAMADPEQDIPNAENHAKQLCEALAGIGVLTVRISEPITRAKLHEAILEDETDAFYFLGHGKFRPDIGGELHLEADGGGVDRLEAEVLGQWVRERNRPLKIAYLNSCVTGQTRPDNMFAGVAQRLMLTGQIGAVIAMQAPVKATDAARIASRFFQRLQEAASPEQALLDARTMASDQCTQGVPVIYTHIAGPEYFRRNRIRCLLDADERATFSISLPQFRMGVLRDDFERGKVKVGVTPEDAFHYLGVMLAQTDVKAALYVLRLLQHVVPIESVALREAGTREEDDATHQFYFGSRSHANVQGLLRVDSDFRLHYKHEAFDGCWLIEDRRRKKAYVVEAPYRLQSREFHQRDDFGLIEKIVDSQTGRVFFVLAGLGDRATLGCGYFLWDRWEQLLKLHPTGSFAQLLHVPGSLLPSHARPIDPDCNDLAVEMPAE